MPAAENPQGLGFRFSRFLRLWVGGLSRRLLSPYPAGQIVPILLGLGFIRRVQGLKGSRVQQLCQGFRVQGFKGSRLKGSCVLEGCRLYELKYVEVRLGPNGRVCIFLRLEIAALGINAWT